MKWLEEQFKTISNERQVIISFHIFPGQFFPGKDQTFWEENFVKSFKSILKQNKDKILIILGAHTHLLDFRYEEDFFGLIATPAISPEFGNNPGYASFEVKDNKIQNL